MKSSYPLGDCPNVEIENKNAPLQFDVISWYIDNGTRYDVTLICDVTFSNLQKAEIKTLLKEKDKRHKKRQWEAK